MAIYQPSFCIPHNESIDATNQDDMTFSWKLNGNNPLVAYNIRIFDNDTNELVYELVSTQAEREIEEKIDEINGWIEWQEQKQLKVNESREEYESSNIIVNFQNELRKIINKHRNNFKNMESLVVQANKKRKGEKDENGKEIKISADDVLEYFRNWQAFLDDLQKCIGLKNTSLTNNGEYILKTLDKWMNVDPDRKDGIGYYDDDKVEEIVDRSKFNKIKEQYDNLRKYYEGVHSAYQKLSQEDITYVNDDTLNKAKQSLFLIYSEFSNEAYFRKDLFEAINDTWKYTDFDKLSDRIDNVYTKWMNEITQQESALAGLTGGLTNKQANIYSSAVDSASNIQQVLDKGSNVAVITSSTTVPAGWFYISSRGMFGYIKSSDVDLYNLKDKKYCLEYPIYPTNSEGEQNTVYHQLPLKTLNKEGNLVNTLENGKEYKWSVTLYWNTSGKYNEYNKIDGSLTSVENYFNTRKRPVIGIKNFKELFSYSYNYVTVNKDISIYVEKDKKNVNIKKGSNVRIITLQDDKFVNIEYVDSNNNNTYQGITDITNLSDLGLYDSEEAKNVMPLLLSKKATFIGDYQQDEHTSIAYFRWILYKLQYDTEEIVEVVKDTGMVPSVDFQFFYEGFLNDEKYALKLFVQTLDNVEVESELYKFKASYLTYPIQNMLNAENSPIEHGIIVEWSNLRLIQGEVTGGHKFLKDIPTKGKTSFQIDKNSTLVFDKDKGKPLSVDFDANQILSIRFDEERPIETQHYYTASGLDDNGDVVVKSLDLVPKKNSQKDGVYVLEYTVRTARETTTYQQEIIASRDFWYIIIMTSTGFTIYTKYAKGLFPAVHREEMDDKGGQYPDRNRFTGADGLYPDALTYLEEPSKKVTYDYQTIVDRDGNKI